MNLCILKGRLGKDPDLRYTQGGTAVCKFTLAVPDKIDPKNKDKTYWANIVAWGKVAEVISKYLAKGQEALFVGRLSESTWEKDGVKHRRTEITVESMEFCGSPKERTSKEQEPPWVPADIPF